MIKCWDRVPIAELRARLSCTSSRGSVKARARLGQAETTIEAQSGLSEAKTEVRARARIRRAIGRATRLAVAFDGGRTGSSGNGGGRTESFRASLGGGNVK